MGLGGKKLKNAILAAVLVAMAALAVFYLYALSREASRLSEMRVSLNSTMDAAKQLETKLTMIDEEIAKLGLVKVELYFSSMTETEIFLVPVKRVVDKENLVVNTLKALIAGPGENKEGLLPVMPAGVKVIGASVDKKVASADFSDDILRAGYGSEGELAMVSAIVNTLCGLPDIDKVQILVGGDKVESLGGHVMVGEPIEAMDELVRR